MYVHLDKMMSILLLLELTLVKYYATDCCLNELLSKQDISSVDAGCLIMPQVCNFHH